MSVLNTFIRPAIALAFWGLAGHACATAADAETAGGRPPPNVLLIVADDLGYSDIGAFGAEIETPALDRLADSGLRLSNFHAAPTCSPTRSMLLSGTDNHTAGMGAMAEVPRPSLAGRYGYEGRITGRVATLAERLRVAGYATVLSGKWHLGLTEESWPSNRGFEHSFALLQGGHNHFGNSGFGAGDEGPMAATYVDDGKPVDVPGDFYSSDYFTDKLIAKIGQVAPEQPVFAMLSFTAPHSPLQAPRELIEKYRGRYDGGWAQLREQRVARLKRLGLIDDRTIAVNPAPDASSWDRLSDEEKRVQARAMEIYAAMVDSMDTNIGRVISYLDDTGRLDNTFVLFISDNGPAGQVAKDYMVVPSVRQRFEQADHSFDNMGGATSYVFYGPHWAAAASSPFRGTKGEITEGGTRVPAIIAGVGVSRQNAISDAYTSVMDVVPTVLALAGIDVAEQVAGRTVAPVTGRSLVPLFGTGAPDRIHTDGEPIAYELHGQRVVVDGDWKLLLMPAPLGAGHWQLFNLADDPGEHRDLADKQPEIRQKLIAAWDRYAESAQVLVQ